MHALKLTQIGNSVGVILPLDPSNDPSQVVEGHDAAAAWDAFVRAGRRLEGRLRPGVSGVRLLAGMRR